MYFLMKGTIYHKKLVHTTMEAEKSNISNWRATNLRQSMAHVMVYIWICLFTVLYAQDGTFKRWLNHGVAIAKGDVRTLVMVGRSRSLKEYYGKMALLLLCSSLLFLTTGCHIIRKFSLLRPFYVAEHERIRIF